MQPVDGDLAATPDSRGLTPTGQTWGRVQWEIVAAEDAGYYRIRNRREPATGYLGREGELNGSTWEPQPTVYVGELDPTGWHQQWSIQDAGDGTVSFVNRWAPESGVLTRDGIERDDGSFRPGRTVSLHAPEDWSSQHWRFDN